MSSAAPARLLAKAPHPRFGDLTLEQHLRDTEEAARLLFCGEERAAKSFMRFFGLRSEAAQKVFRTSLRVAALFHDIGKANAHFYGMVAGTRHKAQTIRHEHLSGLVLCLKPVREWLSKSGAVDFDAVVAAVLSHHVKAALEEGDRRWAQPRDERVLATYLTHPEVRAALDEIAGLVGAPAPLLPANPWREAAPWDDAYAWGRRAASQLTTKYATLSKAEIERRPVDEVHRERRQLVLATKVALIASDGVASASFRLGLTMKDWVDGALHRAPLTREEIQRDVIEARVASIVRRKGSFKYQDFQEGVATLGSRSLLVAPCGAGKTLAAWRWIAEQAAQRPVARAIFLYPTRGTATEGFRDYVGWAPETDAALVHGTAQYELDGLRENPSEATDGKDFALGETEARLFAFGLWPRRYFSATVDQFLGFMEHQYASLCLVPALADSVVVVDEVHSFDEPLFANFLALLHAFDVPVLAMTATLPNARREQLEAAGMARWPREDDAGRLHDLEERAKRPRYVIELADGASHAMAVAREALVAKRRVLWVVNTVGRAQSLARQLRNELASPVLCYHSRYKLKHRQEAHAATIAAFQADVDEAVIAVTTQVCEMSLDLDADVLITECAPATSLVQRLGRSNRHERRGATFRARVVVYEPERAAPYLKEELQDARAFLEKLVAHNERGVSQHDLETELGAMPSRQAKTAASGRLLTSGWFAVPGSLRDADEFTRQAVLDVDLPTVLALLKSRQPIDGYLVPVPQRSARDAGPGESDLPKWIGVAPADCYEPDLGFISEGGTKS